MEYAHKTSNCIIGKEYLVAHAVIQHIDSEIDKVPIFPHLHADPAFSLGVKHYHIDARFKMSNGIKDRFGICNGKTKYVVWVEEHPLKNVSYKVQSIEYIPIKCIRKSTGIEPPLSNDSPYFKWYESMLGKSCTGKKCPHYGTQMIEAGGKVYCPMHNLHADPETLIVVNPY